MKDYIKPTFTLAGLIPTALAATCSVKVTSEDLTEIYAVFGVTDPKQAFTESDGCDQPIPDGLTQYCKFTSTPEATGIVISS